MCWYSTARLPRLSLPTIAPEPEIPLYTGDIEADMREMTGSKAFEHGGKLSLPSKMDVPAWAIPASTCKTGSKLAEVSGSVCEGCYAKKGTMRFKNVQHAFAENYRKLFDPLWTPAMASLIRWNAKDRFRWMLSGDLQSVDHLKNIIQIAMATRNVLHWLPTREQAMVKHCRELIPGNLTVRISGTMVNGDPPSWWPQTSTVVSNEEDATCPSSIHGGNCGEHDCDACWDPDVGNVKYLKH